MLDIIRSWSVETQFWFFFGLAGGGLILAAGILKAALTTVQVLLRGYPPEAGAPECARDDNLTGRCLERSPCRTAGECEEMVRLENRGEEA